MSAFPMGFWNYVDIAYQDASAVRDWADAGMTLTMGPNYGPDPDEVALAEARIATAEAQLAAAQEALADLELQAPFAGTIAEVHIHASEWVAPGSPVLRIADLAHLQVETTDLGEIDVAQIVVGDTALVTFDALPGLVLAGRVISIAPKAAPGSGVNFPVILALNEIPPELRWGMTAFVDIELE